MSTKLIAGNTPNITVVIQNITGLPQNSRICAEGMVVEKTDNCLSTVIARSKADLAMISTAKSNEAIFKL